MRDRDNELKPGKRVRLSALGKERSPRIKIKTGVIVGETRHRDALRILLDGNKMPMTLHKSYIEPR